ncbi:MAG: 50S ribosomal L9 C-terminal domain-containing protein, partial [Candidatus Nanopelagicaceae bacterium]
IKVKVGSTGRLFGSVTEKDVAQVIKNETGVDIDRHKIKLIKHVKNLGKYTAKVSLITGVSANITVNVVE